MINSSDVTWANAMITWDQAQFTWDLVKVIINAGSYTPYEWELERERKKLKANLDEAVAIYVELYNPLLSEEQQKMMDLAGIKQTVELRNKVKKDIKVMVDNITTQQLQQEFGVSKFEDLKPSITLENFIYSVLGDEKPKITLESFTLKTTED